MSVSQGPTTPTGMAGVDGLSRGRAGAAARPKRGWVTFAGLMLVFSAIANVIWAVAAFAKDQSFDSSQLHFGGLALWGAWLLCLAALQLLVSPLVFLRTAVGAGLGIAVALLAAITQLLVAGVYPVWSVTVLVVNALIIYGLAVHALPDE